jgi:hypothetical protein
MDQPEGCFLNDPANVELTLMGPVLRRKAILEQLGGNALVNLPQACLRCREARKAACQPVFTEVTARDREGSYPTLLVETMMDADSLDDLFIAEEESFGSGDTSEIDSLFDPLDEDYRDDDENDDGMFD